MQAYMLYVRCKLNGLHVKYLAQSIQHQCKLCRVALDLKLNYSLQMYLCLLSNMHCEVWLLRCVHIKH